MTDVFGTKYEAVLDRVRATLLKPDTVVLVGSGISQWSGLPSWGQLISELADYLDTLGLSSIPVRQAADQNDLLLAASYGAFQLMPAEFANFIRRACRVGAAKPHEIHRLIGRLGPTCFITTNYDKLLEDSLAVDGPAGRPQVVTSRQIVEISELFKASSKNFVFKYHGDVEDAEGVILTRDQYAKLHGSYAHVSKAVELLLASVL